jgi:uncharacterized protein YjbJ (UPF0337 family)
MKKVFVKVSLLVCATFFGSEIAQASTPSENPAKADSVKDSLAANLNKDVLEGKWKQLKGKIQQKWSKLTDDDILKMQGTTTELEGKLQEKYGYKKEQIEKEIRDFLDENKDAPHNDTK